MSEDIPIWRIKYLPRTLDDICGREKIKERLKKIIKQRNFPHLLFVGSEGIGKTTLTTLFSKEFLGRYYDANFKLVYANVPLTVEERKQAEAEVHVPTSRIGSTAGKTFRPPWFIQARVKPFVQLKVFGDVPFKILIIKNFDALNNTNMQGFRRVMEIYGSNCRMILITTKISGVIDPIVSRCQLFLISQVDLDSFKELMNKIADNESFEIEDNVIETLYNISEGKLSRAIDILQLSSISGKTIDSNKLFVYSQKFQNDLIRSLLLMALRGDFPKSRDLSRNIISTYKYTPHELFNIILNELNKLPLSKFARAHLINLIADADFRALDSLDGDIQISALLSKICLFSEHL
ncbi:MAG: AAA family ATPase [Candidatus Hodarchaeota archaeon]